MTWDPWRAGLELGPPRVAIAMAFAAALFGCGLKRVSPDVVTRLPIEAKIELLEAENDLYAAIDRYDEAVDRALHTREELRRARARIGEAKEARSRASDAKDPRQREISALAVEEAHQKRDFLDEWVEVQWALVEVEEANLDVGRARYEHAKAILAKKTNTQGSEKLDPASFEVQVKRYAERAQAVLAVAEARRKRAEEVRSGWNTTRRALAQKTGGALGSAWVE